jgi:exo-beta-1,3-glucanase (GH17 family)
MRASLTRAAGGYEPANIAAVGPRLRTSLLAVVALLAATRAEADVERLRAALASVRFVAYTPRGFDPDAGAPPPDPAALRADLVLLHRYFDGLITYSCANGLDALPRLAREAGFRAVVLGVWSPSDSRELSRALAAAGSEPDVVIALAIGNEGLFFHRYDVAALREAFARARRERPGLALATSEPFSLYLDRAPADLPREDFLLPNVHPVDQPWFGSAPPATSVEFVANVVAKLEERFALPVLVKETGLPSGPSESGFSPAAQAEFWSALARRLPPTRAHAFAWFEAFDSPWKPARAREAPSEKRAREAYWGLFESDGRAKPALAELAK